MALMSMTGIVLTGEGLTQQADVMLKEIEGVRKAVREGSIVDVSSESKAK